MENNNVQLHPVTWLALVALGFVGYLYVRQKSLEKKLTQGQPSYANETRGPQATPYFGASSRQPNFNEKEIEPRKLAKDLDTDAFKQKSPKYQPSFEQFGLSGDRNKRQGFEGLEKAFDDSRRMTSYKPLQKPVESYSVFADLGKSEQPAPTVSSNIPVHSTPSNLINKGISLYPGGLSGKIEPEIENRQAPTEEIISTKEKLNIIHDDNDNEYKVFREFKQKESRVLHEEPKRFESPQRQAWGISPLDHSPDSPFRIFESSLAGSIKRDDDLIKHPKQRAGTSLIANKKDPFLKAQDALNERVNPIGSKLSKFAAKAESKNRSNQIFMDVDSDEDSMLVETQRGHGNINKRSGAESQSVDALERDSLKSKYFKDNNLKSSFKGPEGKRITLGQNLQSVGIGQKAGAAKDSKDQSKKKSSTDIAYLTEYGSNLTMKRYMERKALTDSAAKASRLSSSMIAPSKTSTSMIAEEPVSRSLLINKPAAVAVEKPKPAQSFTSSLKSDGILIGGSSKTTEVKKPTIMESETIVEAPIKKDNKPDFGTKTVAEPAKISSILGGGGSSIFAQPKPAVVEVTPATTNGSSSLFGGNKKPETEEPKKTIEPESVPVPVKEETITPKEPSPIETIPQTQALPKGFNMGGDLFKTQKFGSTMPTKPEENKEKPAGGLFGNLTSAAAPKKEEEPEKSISSPKEEQPKAPLFGFLAGGKSASDTDKAPAQQQNGEKKSIFGGDLTKPAAATFGGFSNLSNNPELKKEDSKKSETGSTSLFGSSKPAFGSGSGSGSLFGGKKDENTEKPADEQPKTSFFNKTEQAPAVSGGLFGNLTKKASSPDSSSSPKNDQKPASSGLFGNTSSSFLKSGTAPKEDDTQNKAPMFGSLKPVGSSENKPAGSLFGNTTSSLGGGPSLFSNAAAGSGAAPASGSLFGSGAATSLKTPSTGLFASLTNNANKEGGSGLFSNK